MPKGYVPLDVSDYNKHVPSYSYSKLMTSFISNFLKLPNQSESFQIPLSELLDKNHSFLKAFPNFNPQDYSKNHSFKVFTKLFFKIIIFGS